jgi:xanthine dehydrogenase accessory factor
VSELTDVLAAIESLAARGERMALATIVAVKGSTYRRPGARLVVPEDGAPIGNISGGCLEGDVADMARIVLREGVPRIAAWDLTTDDDDVWGLGLGCNGAIEVFVEPADRAAAVAGTLRAALAEERPIAMVTVLDGDDAGARLVVRPDGAVEGSLGASAARSSRSSSRPCGSWSAARATTRSPSSRPAPRSDGTSSSSTTGRGSSRTSGSPAQRGSSRSNDRSRSRSARRSMTGRSCSS